LAKKIFFTCSKIKLFTMRFLATKKEGKKISPSSFGAVVESGVRDG
jgi:hypothetical protein